MGRIVYIHGQFVPEEEARIGLFDRGFLFADAVYEVTSVLGGRLVDFGGHLARLHRSLAALATAYVLITIVIGPVLARIPDNPAFLRWAKARQAERRARQRAAASA